MRWILKVLSVLALGWVVVVGFGRGAVAPGDRAGELVGTWRVGVTLVDCTSGAPVSPVPFPSLLTFAVGGTMAEDTTNPAFGAGQRGGGQGIWNYEGRRTYAAQGVSFIKYTTPRIRHAQPGLRGGRADDYANHYLSKVVSMPGTARRPSHFSTPPAPCIGKGVPSGSCTAILSRGGQEQDRRERKEDN